MSSPRRFLVASSFACVALASTLLGSEASAGDAPEAKPLPPLATNADAKAALLAYREAFKARDVAAKADAVDGLGKVQHPDVIVELLKLTKHREAEIRAAAFQNLAREKALPTLVGVPLGATVDAKTPDWQYVTDVIDTLSAVHFRGGLPTLVKLLHHPDQSVVRWSLDALGDSKDVRALEPVLELMHELKLDEAAKWEGGEVHVDTGASGDADQRAAEAAYAAKYGSGGGKKSGGSRKTRSLGEFLFLVVKDLTGQSFTSGKAAREWVTANAATLAQKRKVLDDEQKAQDEAGKAAVAAARAAR